jgi:hypothetical protein
VVVQQGCAAFVEERVLWQVSRSALALLDD